MKHLQEFQISDGQRTIDIFQRPDGFFSYEKTFKAFDEIAGEYWSTGYQSGIFETREAALDDIRSTVPWLRNSAVFKQTK